MGARWGAPRDGDIVEDAVEAEPAPVIDRSDAALPTDDMGEVAQAAAGPRPWLALLPIAVAGLWLLYTLLTAAGIAPPPPPAVVAAMLPTLAPLILALLLYIVVARGGHGEARRFRRVAGHMQRETLALEAVLARMADMIADQNRLLADQAAQLVALGDETADRIGAIRSGFTQDSATFTEQGAALARATDAARIDLGVILADLPRIDAQVRGLSDRLRDTGLSAHEQAGALDAQLVAIVDHARDADQVAGAAAQRLAAHLARVEGVSDVAAERIDAAGTRMAATADRTLEQAATVLDALRTALAAEQATLTAIVTESHALIGSAGTVAVAAVRDQVDLLETRLAGFGTRVAREGTAVGALAATLTQDLDRAGERFERLAQDGGAATLHIVEQLDTARLRADTATAAIDTGGTAVDRLIQRADRLTRAMELVGTALQGADLASARIVARVDQSLPTLSGFADVAGHAGDALDRSGEAIERNRAALDALSAGLARTDADTQALADAATPALIDALHRVRAAADDAAGHVRAAFAAIGPDAGADLAAATCAIVDTTVTAAVDRNLASLSAAAARATDAASATSEHLVHQLAAIADTASAVEARIAAARQETADADQGDFAQRVALLIEGLNSTAIDVTKILGQDVADDAWAAYLRGDRGVFTRRAVRLLDHADARTIAAHYGEDSAFHDQVNRYVHDFEAMLRRVLASRDGTPMGVTLLSSDMGKLYVALAQAIERLRA
ncbi:hypothetical protein [Sphingomonas montana]|uniref:hypothetical protein n=1 Tax=Sphingomonas montana TaxID=1843236 RepID=UPI00101AE7FC|nr:hypothetical protein [Sphingomonas montana]